MAGLDRPWSNFRAPTQAPLPETRKKYRKGRRDRAVKTFTVAQESKYLLILNVHAVGTVDDLIRLCALYGTIEEYRLLDDYETEEFTDAYWIKYEDINAARIAKRKLDDYSFLGKALHVTYAPEFETTRDTREKLKERRIVVLQKLNVSTAPRISSLLNEERRKRHRTTEQQPTGDAVPAHTNQLAPFKHPLPPQPDLGLYNVAHESSRTETTPNPPIGPSQRPRYSHMNITTENNSAGKKEQQIPQQMQQQHGQQNEKTLEKRQKVDNHLGRRPEDPKYFENPSMNETVSAIRRKLDNAGKQKLAEVLQNKPNTVKRPRKRI